MAEPVASPQVPAAAGTPSSHGSETGPTEKKAPYTTQEKTDEIGIEADEPQPHVHARTFLAIFAVTLIYFAQDFALVGAGAQGQIIAGHFNGLASLPWLTAPITIETVVLGPIVSQAADYWGRKWFLVILSLVGAVGSVIVARATSMPMVIAGFSVIGLAFGMQPLLHVVPSEVLPRRWRAWAQAAVMISNALGLISGLLVGGALNRNGQLGFPTYFLISMALFAAAAVICLFAYRPPPRPLQTALTFREKMSRLDWIGYALLAFSLVLFCVGLSWSQNPYEWTDPHTSAPFAIGVALGLGLIFYETKVKKDGMFHHELFRGNRNYAISLFCVACEGIAFIAVNIYFAFQVSVLYESDFLLVGVRFSICYIATTVASLVTGLYCATTKRVRWVTVGAFVMFTVFFACMATTNATTSQPVWGYAVLMGWALGMTLITLVTAAQLSTTGELIAIASGLIIAIRSLGATIGIAIYNAVFIDATRHMADNIAHAVTEAGLPPTSVPEFLGDLLSQNTTGLPLVSGVTPDIIGSGVGATLDTYTKGFRNVWATAAAFVGLAAIAAAFLYDPSKEFNNHIDAPVEKEEELYSS